MSVTRKRFQSLSGIRRIPKGFRNKAQEERPTLGNRGEELYHNPNGVATSVLAGSPQLH
jgi:hypothetical protein